VTPEALARLYAVAFPGQRPWSAAEFADLLSLPGAFLITRTDGYALGRSVAGEAELLSLAVVPSARRQGLGHQLLMAFEAAARDRDAKQAFLEVAADNQAARSLYLAAGWSETGKRREYYMRQSGPDADAILMQKPLS
jgi:ribosomal-protein-alanine N-acetyltransferase